MGQKSVIPDLIFNETRQERIQEIGELYCRKQLWNDEAPMGLHRVTVFATHRCNFKCEYCNGPHLNKTILPEEKSDFLSRELSPKLFRKLLNDWQKHGLRYVHFTGGEATLNKNLPMFVREASKRGMLSALTTNGSASPDFYRELVLAGLREIRISIDSNDADEFERIVRTKGSFEKVEKTILELVKMRDEEGMDIFIILNACMQSFDMEKCKSTITGLLRYKSNDMKILVIAEDAKEIEEKASRKAVDDLLALVRNANPNGYELLERKIHTMFRRDTFGLKSMAVRHLMNHCLIPITERTVDGKYVYPCSIYVRYHGEPLAPIKASFREQQNVSVAFAENHNCRRDPICSANCTFCCREFNVEANKQIEGIRIKELSKKYPVINIPEISDDEMADVMAKFNKINETKINEPYPFFIIKPLGLPKKKEIIRYLFDQGIKILEMDKLPDWFNFTMFLYFKEKHLEFPDRVKFKIACNKAFRQLEEPGGYVLRLEKEVPFKKIYRIKSELRSWFGDEHRVMRYNHEMVTLHLNAIHAPDSMELEWQNKVIEYFLKGGKNGRS